MKFTETVLKGAFIIELEPNEDERGFLARTWCRREFEAHGLNTRIEQSSISFNRKVGTLRGLHYQAKPYEETKLVSCMAGAIYDVIVDLRVDSFTYKGWLAVDLTAANRRILYVPKGFGHGFQTLEDRTEVFYQISESYQPEFARGIRWDDPAFAFSWPLAERIMSERDRTFADFTA